MIGKTKKADTHNHTQTAATMKAVRELRSDPSREPVPTQTAAAHIPDNSERQKLELQIATLTRNFETLSSAAAKERLELCRLREAEGAWSDSRAAHDQFAKLAAEERGKLHAQLAAAEQRGAADKRSAERESARAAEAEMLTRKAEAASKAFEAARLRAADSISKVWE